MKLLYTCYADSASWFSFTSVPPPNPLDLARGLTFTEIPHFPSFLNVDYIMII